MGGGGSETLLQMACSTQKSWGVSLLYLMRDPDSLSQSLFVLCALLTWEFSSSDVTLRLFILTICSPYSVFLWSWAWLICMCGNVCVFVTHTRSLTLKCGGQRLMSVAFFWWFCGLSVNHQFSSSVWLWQLSVSFKDPLLSAPSLPCWGFRHVPLYWAFYLVLWIWTHVHQLSHLPRFMPLVLKCIFLLKDSWELMIFYY